MNFNEKNVKYKGMFFKQHDYIYGMLNATSKKKYIKIIEEINSINENDKKEIYSIISRLQQICIASENLKSINYELETRTVSNGNQASLQPPMVSFYFESLIIQTQATLDSVSKIIFQKIAKNSPIDPGKYYYHKLISFINNSTVDLSNETQLKDIMYSTLENLSGIVYGTNAPGGTLRNNAAHKVALNDLIFSEFTINGYSNNKVLMFDQYVNDFPILNSSISLTQSIINICFQTIRCLIIKSKPSTTLNIYQNYSLDINWETKFIKWKGYILENKSGEDFTFNQFKTGKITIKEVVNLDSTIFSNLTEPKKKKIDFEKVFTNASKDEFVLVTKN
jgi:hypothetical protein